MASNKKINYVRSKKVMNISKGANYVIVYGGYSNGKSYAVKSGVVEECFKKDKMLAYNLLSTTFAFVSVWIKAAWAKIGCPHEHERGRK